MSIYTGAYVARVIDRLRRRGDPDSQQALDALLGLSTDELEILARQEAGR